MGRRELAASLRSHIARLRVFSRPLIYMLSEKKREELIPSLNVPCIPDHHGHNMQQDDRLSPRKSSPVHGEYLRAQERPS